MPRSHPRLSWGQNMILEEETFEKFGYYPSTLSRGSNKKIIVICDECLKQRIIQRNQYHTLCRSCSHKGEKNINFGKTGNEFSNWIEKQVCVCKQCGIFFPLLPSRIREGKGTFCSNKCQGLWESKNMRGNKHPKWQGGKIKCICPKCGTIFFRKRNEVKQAKDNYCSPLCARKGRQIPTHHTKPELIFQEICKKNSLPFKYTGDGSFWIHNINPDFVECNGKKIAVEIFGDYWHSPLLRQNISYSQTYKGRKKALKKYGWELIMFWETDLLRLDAESFILSQLNKVLI